MAMSWKATFLFQISFLEHQKRLCVSLHQIRQTFFGKFSEFGKLRFHFDEKGFRWFWNVFVQEKRFLQIVQSRLSTWRQSAWKKFESGFAKTSNLRRFNRSSAKWSWPFGLQRVRILIFLIPWFSDLFLSNFQIFKIMNPYFLFCLSFYLHLYFLLSRRSRSPMNRHYSRDNRSDSRNR